jgi:hypothetical protein
MTTDSSAVDLTPDSTTAPAAPAAPPQIGGLWLRTSPPMPRSWPWLRGALLLAGAAQLVTISDLLGSDPLPVSWSSLLLAIAPVPLGVAAAFAPARLAGLAAIAALGVLIAGLAGQATHAGLLFLPALLVLAVGTFMVWREPA